MFILFIYFVLSSSTVIVLVNNKLRNEFTSTQNIRITKRIMRCPCSETVPCVLMLGYAQSVKFNEKTCSGVPISCKKLKSYESYESSTSSVVPLVDPSK